MIAPDSLRGGLSDPVFQSQAVFREVLDAFARPGTVHDISPVVASPEPLHASTAALICTLADEGTPVFVEDRSDRCKIASDWIAFHTGAPIVDGSKAAAFAILFAPAVMPPLDSLSLGTAEYPDRSTTLVLQIEAFGTASTISVEGPGIKSACPIDPRPLPTGFMEFLRDNGALYPRGVDLVLVTPSQLMALPRSVRAGPAGEA
jgi:alpha-D-ribose 1-methylphosphonate 5-triphosphate synthase subunit PhnH